MGDVVDLGVITRLKIPADRVLTSAVDKLEDVLVIGYDKDGDFYFAGSNPDGPENLWLLEFAKKRLMEVGDPDDAG